MTEQHDQPQGDWTTKDLAQKAGVSSTYIRQLLIAKQLDGYKRGRDWRIPASVALRWLETRKDNGAY